MPWENLFWSHHVHRYLGETLHYYLLDVTPFDSQRVIDGLRRLIDKRRLGGLRAYTVFGRHDLIIRTWLHPAIAVHFLGWLDEAIPEMRGKRQFTVTDITHTWYDVEGESASRDSLDFLQGLHEHNIKNLQRGEETALLAHLRKHRLVHESKSSALGIKFFVTVRLSEPYASKKAVIAQNIAAFCLRQPDFLNVATYVGVGDDFAVFVKAQSNDFFSISAVPLYINRAYEGTETETFLCLEREHLLGDGRIGAATFEELRGRDLIVQGIIKEVYRGDAEEKPGWAKRAGRIVDFVRRAIGPRQLHPKERLLIRDYLLGYVDGDETAMMKVLFETFISLEHYFRKSSKQYVGKMCPGRYDEIFAKAGAEKMEDRKYMALGSLFKLFSVAMANSKDSPELRIFKSYNALVALRNMTLHGDLQLGDDSWSTPLETVLEHYQGLQELVFLVSGSISMPFEGRYF